MNNQRRMFRGRGGPTDRQLPKHNARRTNHRPRASKPATNKYQDQDQDQDHHASSTENVLETTEVELIHSSDPQTETTDEDEDDSRTSEEVERVEESPDTQDSHRPTVAVPPAATDNGSDIATTTTTTTTSETMTMTMTMTINACTKEVHHLQRRVRNVREGIQLSPAIANPKTYQENVLNAVSNCVHEWRSIATHYPLPPTTAMSSVTTADTSNGAVDYERDQVLSGTTGSIADNEDGDETVIIYLTPELQKLSGLAVFELIQLALQSGPLAGAKPGYFKRCGGTVAKVVVPFLQEVIPHHTTTADRMGFSTKQRDAMTKWLQHAEQAVVDDRPPSRTALKHQQGKGAGKKAKKKNRK